MACSPEVARAQEVPAMIVGTVRHGNVTILAVLPRAIPALRLLSWHAPDFKVECVTAGNATIYIPLSELDITHPTLDRLNAGRPSFVESTLAAPGK